LLGVRPRSLSHLWLLAAAGVLGFIGNEIAASPAPAFDALARCHGQSRVPPPDRPTTSRERVQEQSREQRYGGCPGPRTCFGSLVAIIRGHAIALEPDP
jgi:hypothetical protein